MKKVIITGILGQDGANLAEYLLSNYPNIQVYGVYRRGSNPNQENIASIKHFSNLKLLPGDITDQSSIDNIVSKVQPDYFVNLAANSFVGTSWGVPEQVFHVNTIGVLKCLESIRKFAPFCRFYSAGSSEEFGDTVYEPQDENHPFIPVSPYAVAKTAARHILNVYRMSYGLFAVHGTLFNHEGPKRGIEFVTRKITQNIAKISNDLEATGKTTHKFSLGNIYSYKDWSDSRDMVVGIWAMLNTEKPKDYILASGETRTVKDFVSIATRVANIDGHWQEHSDPLQVKFVLKSPTNQVIVDIDKNLYRPTEVGVQRGDSSLARKELNWTPAISFEQMIKDMITNDKRCNH